MSKPSSLAEVIRRARRVSTITPEEAASDERREARDRRRQFLAEAHPDILPEDVQAIVRGTLDDNPWLRKVQRWLEGSTRVLVLSGSVGSGKSTAACWAIAERGGRFVSAPNLARVSSSFKRAEWDQLVAAPVVDIDDLGDELDPASLSPALKLLISARVAHAGRTILTTNIPVHSSDPAVETLKKRYPDEKLWSRIAQSYAVCTLNAPDLRREPLR